MPLSVNELKTRDLMYKISRTTNLSYDVVETVVNGMLYHILKDCSEQADKSTEVIIRVPRMMDIYLSKDKYVTVNGVYLTPKFKEQLGGSMTTDIDYLHDKVIKSASDAIVGKYLKLLDDIKNGSDP